MDLSNNQPNSSNHQDAELSKTKQGLIIGIAVCAVFALAGTAFGVYGMTKPAKLSDSSEVSVHVQKDDGSTVKLKTEKVETSKDDETIITVEDSPAVPIIDSSSVICADPQASSDTSSSSSNNSSSTPEDLENYIYIPQWGIKIKFPTDLKNLNYKYNGNSLSISGLACTEHGQCQYPPEFANSDVAGYLGYVTRTPSDQPLEYSGTPTFTLDGYTYYTGNNSYVNSMDEDEKQWEAQTMRLIKDAISNPSNWSRI